MLFAISPLTLVVAVIPATESSLQLLSTYYNAYPEDTDALHTL